MSAKNPLVVVCAIAFLAGGAAALVFTRPAPGPASVHAATGREADASRAATAGNFESAKGASEGVRAGMAAVPGGGETAPGGVAVGEESTPPGVEEVGVKKSSRGTRSRAPAGRADEGSRAARGYARATSARRSSGGKGVADYPVGGVKKTGEGVKKTGRVVGRTFGKLGGVFHD